MIVSSGRGDRWWRGRCEGSTVAQQRPQHVDQAAGQGEQGLGMDQPLAALALVEDTRGAVGSDAGQRGHVEHPPQPAVVALGAAQVAGNTAGVSGDGDQAGYGQLDNPGRLTCSVSRLTGHSRSACISPRPCSPRVSTFFPDEETRRALMLVLEVSNTAALGLAALLLITVTATAATASRTRATWHARKDSQ